jgi:hypothetical protein
MATGIHPKLLLVEGDEDKRVIPYLMEANGIDWGKPKDPAVHIEAFGGVERMLEPGRIESRLKTVGLEALGILVDADGDAERRAREVLARCRTQFGDLPPRIPREGLIATNADGLRLGIWIMPDNQSPGMMETFLAYLRPETNGSLLAYVHEAWTTAKTHGAPCKDVHVDKAKIHTWLAWQDPPGLQLHNAVLTRTLDPRSPHAKPFVDWFKNLFALDSAAPRR